MTYLLIRGDARRIPLADRSVHCVVTSPPYHGLRDYGVAGQIGLESTPDDYVAALVAAFREVWRVLRDDGTLWLNLGDTYNSSPSNQQGRTGTASGLIRPKFGVDGMAGMGRRKRNIPGLKPKDLIGIPWRVAFALQADGWYLRSDIIWSKPNPMPESVRDRPTKSHEYLFLLTKRERYFYDKYAVREPRSGPLIVTPKRANMAAMAKGPMARGQDGFNHQWAEGRVWGSPSGRNRRTVWTINPVPYKGAHFATMPPKLAATCIRAGTSRKGCCPRCGTPWRRRPRTRRDAPVVWESACTCLEPRPVPCVVFDPFGGAMTTVVAAAALGRRGVATELSDPYLRLGKRRLDRPHARPAPAGPAEDLPLFSHMEDVL